MDVELGVEPESEHIMLRVADTGIGMSREKLDSVFAAFVQADASTTIENDSPEPWLGRSDPRSA